MVSSENFMCPVTPLPPSKGQLCTMETFLCRQGGLCSEVRNKVFNMLCLCDSG